MRADWADPSNPAPHPSGQQSETNHKEIAAAFTDYTESFFAKKKIKRSAKRIRLKSRKWKNFFSSIKSSRIGNPL